MERYIFEILLYREPQHTFDERYQAAVDTFMKPIRHPTVGANPDHNPCEIVWEDIFWRRYGGPWNYNQIVGAIRLYALGTQIRGELWISDRSRYRRNMSNKNISLAGSVFEVTVHEPTTDADVFREILERIVSFCRDRQRFVADLQCFQTTGPHINWTRLFSPNVPAP